MSAATALRRARYEAWRVTQTPRVFKNWPALLRQLAGERFGRGSATLEFSTRRGLRLTSPNVPGARLPMYEQFADDCYDVEWVLGPPTDRPLQVLDVGAHVGAFATNVAGHRPDVWVECYEPSPDSARFLRGNVERNGLADRVAVHELALAATTGEALLDDNSGGSVHNGLVGTEGRLVSGHDAPGARSTITVRTATFDDAVAAAPAPFDVVKMDCEGGEYELVYASTKTNWASVHRVVMEYHPVSGQSWDELRSWFAEVGLEVARHHSDTPGLGTAWLSRGAR